MRKIAVRILVISVCVMQLVLLASCSLFPQEKELSAPAIKTPKPVTYNYFTVEKKPLTKGSTGTGSVSSIYYYKHSFKTSGGTIKGIYVTLGQYVNKGDLLLETDNTSLELDYLQSLIDYEKALDSFNKQKNQYKNGEISETQYRVYELQFEIVKKTYENLKASYENTQLFAQVSGQVVYINTEYSTNTNKTIVAGETMVAIDSGESKYLYLVFDKAAVQSSSGDTPQQFRIGTELTLNLQATDADPNPIQFSGVIVGTDQIIKDTGIGYLDSTKYYCKITKYPDYGNDPARQIASGTIIQYTYVEDYRDSCLQIPVNAVYSYNGKYYVYMLDRSTNLKKEVYVDLGIANDTRVEVISGLNKGDRIIVG